MDSEFHNLHMRRFLGLQESILGCWKQVPEFVTHKQGNTFNSLLALISNCGEKYLFIEKSPD